MLRRTRFLREVAALGVGLQRELLGVGDGSVEGEHDVDGGLARVRVVGPTLERQLALHLFAGADEDDGAWCVHVQERGAVAPEQLDVIEGERRDRNAAGELASRELLNALVLLIEDVDGAARVVGRPLCRGLLPARVKSTAARRLP